MPRACFKFLLNILLVLVTTTFAFAQQERLTAEEVNIQKVFIEAKKNKILGAFDEAERLFKEVLEKDKQNHAAAYELSRVYVSKNDYAKALEYASLALRINDTITWYYVLKADILEARQEFLKSAEVYHKLTEMKPDEAYYYEHLAEIQQKVAQPEEALGTLDRYEDVFGIIEPVIRRKFDLLNELGKPDEALREVDKLIRIYPEELDYRHLAAAYAKQVGFEERANQYYSEILTIDPNDGKANVAMASAFKTAGDDLTYLASIRTIIRNPSIDVDAKVQELIPYVRKIMDHRDPALEQSLLDLLADLQKNHPHDAKVSAIFGDYYNATDQLVKAREAYEKTLALDDSVFPVWEQLISILASERDWTTLIRTTETAMDVFPNQGSIYFYNGIGYQKKGDYQEAENAFAQALIMSGRDKIMTYKTLVQMGEVCQALAKYKKSDEAFEKAMAINGEAFPALNGYAYVLALRKDRLEKAGNLVEKAMQERPGSARGRITKGLILLQTGNAPEARQILESTEMDAGPGELPLLYEHLGDVFLALNDAEAAMLNWQKALEAGGNEERIQKKLNDHKVN